MPMSKEKCLEDALRYAVLIIQSYESDIRNSDWTGVDLVGRGFCQGDIYRGALKMIERLSEPDRVTLHG